VEGVAEVEQALAVSAVRRPCDADPRHVGEPARWSIIHPGGEDAVCDFCLCVRVAHLLMFHEFLAIVPVLPHTERGDG
jgi:hypothetical protein